MEQALNNAFRISACIVTYKSDIAAVTKAVNSLTSYKYQIDVVIVDNASGAKYRSDLTTALAGKNVTIIDSGMNKGFGAGHNLGFMRASKAEFHLLVNPDIIVHDGAIDNMVDYMRSNPDIGLLAPKIVNEQGELQYLCKRYPTVLALFGRRFLPEAVLKLPLFKDALNRYAMRDADYTQILEPEFISGCFMVFRSSIFSKLQGFDERFFLYFEDTDITLRAREICRAVYYPLASVTHAWKGGAKTSRKLTYIMMQSAVKFFNKWGWKWL